MQLQVIKEQPALPLGAVLDKRGERYYYDPTHFWIDAPFAEAATETFAPVAADGT